MKKWLLTIMGKLIVVFAFSQIQIDLTPKNILIYERQKKFQLDVTFMNKTVKNFLIPEMEPCLPYRDKLLGNSCLLCFTLKTISNGDTTLNYPASQVVFRQFVKEPKRLISIKSKSGQLDYLILGPNSNVKVNYSIGIKELNLKKGNYYSLQLEYFLCTGSKDDLTPTEVRVFSEIVRVIIK